MKAHINGITVEGTPQEIMEYQRLQGEKKPTQQTADVDWLKQLPKVTSGATTAKCPNEGHPCNCTGACMAPEFKIRHNGYFSYPVFNE